MANVNTTIPNKHEKLNQFESLIGPLLSHWNPVGSFAFDDFQLTLYDLLSNATDQGIQQYVSSKSIDLNKFILTLFIASLHNKNPLRVVDDNKDNKDKNPLNSILISPANVLPPPPKRRDSNKLKDKPNTATATDDNKYDDNKNDKKQNDNDNKQNKDKQSAIASAAASAAEKEKEKEFLKRNLSDIDEQKEKDMYSLKNAVKKAKLSQYNSTMFDITPHTSDDKLLSHKNKNFFDDILLTDNSANDRDISKTYESYDGDEFFTNRTLTTREYTTTEKFNCNLKEKAIVNQWRHLFTIKDKTPLPSITSASASITPQPPASVVNDNKDNKDNKDDKDDDDDGVLVKSAADIAADQEEKDVILIEECEMIAPMTKIAGKFKLTSTSITFIPNDVQHKEPNEINLATNPPPLPMSPQMISARMRSSSYGLIKNMDLKTVKTTTINSKLQQQAAANTNANAIANHLLNQSFTSPAHVQVDDDNKSNINIRSPSIKSQKNFNYDDKDQKDQKAEYWVTTNVCSSYQQVGGTRYRLMTAHRFWFINELKEIYYRRYQLRNCAFELFFNDDTSWLFHFYDLDRRNKVFNSIMSLHPTNLIESREFFMNPKKAIKTSKIHHKWCRREITNFEYIMRLNTLAGRTFNDLTQYPVVPWVISDFISDKLDLNDPKIYRDLSKPIGALNDNRLNKFRERYSSLLEDYNLCTDDDEKASMHCFMYGTHYSSIGICLYYLLRMEPFTTYNLKFQGGKFDHADRLFSSILDTFNGCLTNTSDVKELIPEFYYLTDFLSNKNQLDLGSKLDGNRVDNVLLPPWAKNSPESFIKIMREALESEYVSNNLHNWIDLIFGYKQRGIESIKSNNIFHPYTYEGNVDITQINDITQKKAILSQINEFGQTPTQLFKKAHPARLKKSEVLTTIFKAKSIKYYGYTNLTDSSDIGIISIAWIDKYVITIGSDCCVDQHKWEANQLSIIRKKHKGTSSISKIIQIAKKKKQNKIGSSSMSSKIRNKNLCFTTTRDGCYVFACGFVDNSFIVWDVNHSKPYQGISKHHDIVSCLALDENTEKQKAILVTGSYDKSVMVWRINTHAKKDHHISHRKKSKSHSRKHSHSMSRSKLILNEFIDPHPTHILENQLAPVCCVDVSLKSGIIVCCSLDGIVNVYNSSTGEHYHMLQPYIDKAMKKDQLQRKKEELKKQQKLADAAAALLSDNDNDIEPSPTPTPTTSLKAAFNTFSDMSNSNSALGGINSGALSICRVSSVFGHVLCYSEQTKDIFLYSSNGELINCSTSRDDIYYDIQFSKTGNHIACGGKNAIMRIKELPSFKTKKKFDDPKKPISSIYLDKDETYMFVGCTNGNVLVYSLPQKAFVKSRVHTLTELGF